MHIRQTSVKKQQKKVSYLINQTTKQVSPVRNAPDKPRISARFGAASKQSTSKEPESARSNISNNSKPEAVE